RLMELAARVLEPNSPRLGPTETEEDVDAIFAELEAEIENDENPTFREQGIDALKKELESLRGMRQNLHGSYTEITDEKEVIRVSAREPRCVVHFYHGNFRRCEIMDKHLAKLASQYFQTRFFRVFVENVPWLVERLAIKVLPCVICFVNGISQDRLIGFEELGNTDTFTTAALEQRLLSSGKSWRHFIDQTLMYYQVSYRKQL
ncbi:hypothetical protein AMATHDRAFT_139401, partial [Amanita thiersii Skay4041]